MMTLFFNPGPVTSWAEVSKSDKEAFATFFHRMLDEGVYLPPSAFEAMFVSAAHTDEDIDATIAAAGRALGS
jgi:glutamate-1-semialdehyde 2,1-aminomutase